MAKKPKELWHNFDFSQEKRLEGLTAYIYLPYNILQVLIEHMQDRKRRDTGLRFKLSMHGYRSEEGIHLDSESPYIFPNISRHTNVYNSDYNRLEIYIPKSRFCDSNDFGEIEIALSFNTTTLSKLLPLLLQQKTGIELRVKGRGAFEIIDKKREEDYASYQIFNKNSIFGLSGSYEKTFTAIDLYITSTFGD